jgi:hypothetical protein
VSRLFRAPIHEEYEMHGNRRIGFIVSDVDIWYPDRATGFSQMRDDLRDHVLPTFDAYPTLASLVDAIDDGRLNLYETFGPDAGWAHYYYAYALRTAGRNDAALRELRSVVDEHSKCHFRLHLEELLADGSPEAWIESTRKQLAEYEGTADDWVYQREQDARRQITELEG